MATLFPELNVAAFSPNDIIQFSNCCTTASTVCRGVPEIPRKLLAFALNRLDDLRMYYIGRTGEPYDRESGQGFRNIACWRASQSSWGRTCRRCHCRPGDE